MLDAYLLPFQRDIKAAKEHYDTEIAGRVKIIEENTPKNSLYRKAAEAIRENKDLEYFLTFIKISRKHRPTERLGLQKNTYQAITNRLQQKQKQRSYQAQEPA